MSLGFLELIALLLFIILFGKLNPRSSLNLKQGLGDRQNLLSQNEDGVNESLCFTKSGIVAVADTCAFFVQLLGETTVRG